MSTTIPLRNNAGGARNVFSWPFRTMLWADVQEYCIAFPAVVLFPEPQLPLSALPPPPLRACGPAGRCRGSNGRLPAPLPVPRLLPTALPPLPPRARGPVGDAVDRKGGCIASPAQAFARTTSRTPLTAPFAAASLLVIPGLSTCFCRRAPNLSPPFLPSVALIHSRRFFSPPLYVLDSPASSVC